MIIRICDRDDTQHHVSAGSIHVDAWEVVVTTSDGRKIKSTDLDDHDHRSALRVMLHVGLTGPGSWALDEITRVVYEDMPQAFSYCTTGEVMLLDVSNLISAARIFARWRIEDTHTGD